MFCGLRLWKQWIRQKGLWILVWLLSWWQSYLLRQHRDSLEQNNFFLSLAIKDSICNLRCQNIGDTWIFISEHLPSSPKYYPFPWLSSHSWLLCLEASYPQSCLSSSLRDSLNGGTRLSSNTLTLHLWRKVKTKVKFSLF